VRHRRLSNQEIRAYPETGFFRDDTNVMLLVSHPNFARKTVTSPVETMQVAPTILKALRLDPRALDGVRLEGTQALPAVQLAE
jgi:hypothetical protein